MERSILIEARTKMDRHIAAMKISRIAFFLLLGFVFPQFLFSVETLPSIKAKVAFPALKLTRPLWLSEVPDDTKRLFVAQQDGKILILPQDRSGKETKTFLDISDRKPWVQNEEGLLGFAFHPDYKSNGKFYIFYSQQNPRRSVISEFLVSKANRDEADKPGERILFEIPRPEWNHDGSVEWRQSDDPQHQGILTLMRDLNGIYRREPALHLKDCDASGFEWVDGSDAANSIFSFIRCGAGQKVLVVCNFTPVPRMSYRVGVPHSGKWTEILNTDAPVYGGSGVGNLGGFDAEEIGMHGKSHSLNLNLPPLGVIFLRSEVQA